MTNNLISFKLKFSQFVNLKLVKKLTIIKIDRIIAQRLNNPELILFMSSGL